MVLFLKVFSSEHESLQMVFEYFFLKKDSMIVVSFFDINNAY